MPEDIRRNYLAQWAQLEAERSSTWRDWLEAADFVDPWNFRYYVSETNKGGKRARRIINNTAGQANELQAAGMVSGITSPANPWLEVHPQDPGMWDYGPAREWCDVATDVIQQDLQGSNFYETAYQTYLDLGQFGVHCQVITPDPEEVFRVYTFPVGEYSLATSSRGVVDTTIRKYRMTVRQLVGGFGLQSVSKTVQELYAAGSYQTQFDVLHVVEPNEDYEPGKLGVPGKKYRGRYMEMPKAGVVYEDNGGFLLEEGYFECPLQAPRWRAMPGNAYGVSPAMKALGDIKGLQQLERDKGAALQMIVRPPMVGPASMMNQLSSILPGAMNYTDGVSPGQTFQAAVKIDPGVLTATDSVLRPHESRIQAEFKSNLWVSMINGEGDPQKTAREIAEIHEEKMMELGPVYQAIEREYLSPGIDRVLAIELRRGRIPPPPPELLRHGYSVKYQSIVSRALKMLRNSGIEAAVAFGGRVAGVRPEILDNYNLDAMAREHAENIGVKATLMNDEHTVAKIRAQRQQQAEQQQQIDNAQKIAQGAQTLSQTNTNGDNLLTRMLPGGATGGNA